MESKCYINTSYLPSSRFGPRIFLLIYGPSVRRGGGGGGVHKSTRKKNGNLQYADREKEVSRIFYYISDMKRVRGKGNFQICHTARIN